MTVYSVRYRYTRPINLAIWPSICDFLFAVQNNLREIKIVGKIIQQLATKQHLISLSFSQFHSSSECVYMKIASTFHKPHPSIDSTSRLGV